MGFMERGAHEADERPVIVAGFDGSESGRGAVALGRVLAETTGALLLVANVYPYDVVVTPALAVEPSVEDELRTAAEQVIAEAAPLLEGFDAWEPAAIGDLPPARGLLGLAGRRDADLIVVGATHRHGLGRVMPGPTAAKLLHGSWCAVAIAPMGWSRDAGRGVTEIGAGYDGTPESAAALRAAAGLAALTGARVRALAVFDPPSPAHPWFGATTHGYTEIIGELREDLRRRLEREVELLEDSLRIDTRVIDGDPAEVLARESASLDLLVIGSRAYGAVRAVLLGTVSNRLLEEARCPLAVVPRGVAHPLGRLTAGHG
jgi:nucleotide-binding universal stress UspA family protein